MVLTTYIDYYVERKVGNKWSFLLKGQLEVAKEVIYVLSLNSGYDRDSITLKELPNILGVLPSINGFLIDYEHSERKSTSTKMAMGGDTDFRDTMLGFILTDLLKIDWGNVSYMAACSFPVYRDWVKSGKKVPTFPITYDPELKIVENSLFDRMIRANTLSEDPDKIKSITIITWKESILELANAFIAELDKLKIYGSTDDTRLFINSIY